MALDLSLTCNVQANDEQIFNAIIRGGGTLPVREGTFARYRAPGLRGTIMPASKLSRELTQETFSFIPTKEFLFRLDKFSEFESGIASIVSICGLILKELSSESVLSTEDVPILWQKDGMLLLKSSHDDDKRRALLESLANVTEQPYIFQDLPVP